MELGIISDLVQTYDHVAMDTEFPGVILRPVGEKTTQYNTLRYNVDLLKIIQLGISLSDENGETPAECTTWQFNFSFSLQEDMYAPDSIALLRDAGIDFARHATDGIDVLAFAEILMATGLVLNDQITWISFAGGYDFCYLIKVLTAELLPEQETKFFSILHIFFPNLYDIRYLMMCTDRLYGGLNRVAEVLGCQRVGVKHQAGSDSLLTLDVFFRIKEDVLKGKLGDEHNGILHGLTIGNKFAKEKAERRLTNG